MTHLAQDGAAPVALAALEHFAPTLTVRTIVAIVADHHGLAPAVLTSPSRKAPHVGPRQIAMWLARHHTSASLPEIGRRFGGRDHTTVLHAWRKIEDLRTTDSILARRLEALGARINAADAAMRLDLETEVERRVAALVASTVAASAATVPTTRLAAAVRDFLLARKGAEAASFTANEAPARRSEAFAAARLADAYQAYELGGRTS